MGWQVRPWGGGGAVGSGQSGRWWLKTINILLQAGVREMWVWQGGNRWAWKGASLGRVPWFKRDVWDGKSVGLKSRKPRGASRRMLPPPSGLLTQKLPTLPGLPKPFQVQFWGPQGGQRVR